MSTSWWTMLVAKVGAGARLRECGPLGTLRSGRQVHTGLQQTASIWPTAVAVNAWLLGMIWPAGGASASPRNSRIHGAGRFHWLMDSHRSLQSAPARLLRAKDRVHPMPPPHLRGAVLDDARDSGQRPRTRSARVAVGATYVERNHDPSRRGMRIVVERPARPSDSPNAGEVPNLCWVPAVHPCRPT